MYKIGELILYDFKICKAGVIKTGGTGKRIDIEINRMESGF